MKTTGHPTKINISTWHLCNFTSFIPHDERGKHKQKRADAFIPLPQKVYFFVQIDLTFWARRDGHLEPLDLPLQYSTPAADIYIYSEDIQTLRHERSSHSHDITRLISRPSFITYLTIHPSSGGTRCGQEGCPARVTRCRVISSFHPRLLLLHVLGRFCRLLTMSLCLLQAGQAEGAHAEAHGREALPLPAVRRSICS